MHYYTINDVADMMHVHRHTVYDWIQSGRLESARPNGTKKHLITAASLMAFQQRQRPKLVEISVTASTDVAGFFADQIKSERISKCSVSQGR